MKSSLACLCLVACGIDQLPELRHSNEPPTYVLPSGICVYDALGTELNVGAIVDELLKWASAHDPNYNGALVTTYTSKGWPEIHLTDQPVNCEGSEAPGCYEFTRFILWITVNPERPADSTLELLYQFSRFIVDASSVSQVHGLPAIYTQSKGIIDETYAHLQ
jgi:hypothetical protein